MQITLHPTNRLVAVGDASTRVWEGVSDLGDPVSALIAVLQGDFKDHTVLARALLEANDPSPATITALALHPAVPEPAPA
jgi:hypothetical protein